MGLKPRPLVIGVSAAAGGALFFGISTAGKAGLGWKITLTTIGTVLGAGVGLVLSAT